MNEAIDALESVLSPLIGLAGVMLFAIVIYYSLTKVFGVSISSVIKHGWKRRGV